MNAQQLASRLQGVRPSGEGFTARCPAHPDNRSSLSFRDAGDKLLVTCFAGCAIEAIVGALDLHMRDLFNDDGGDSRAASMRKIVAGYEYRDKAGTVLYEVVRFEPKDFRQRQPTPSGEWVWDLKGVRRVLYHLPEIQGQSIVYVVEGEKDVDRLWSLGIPATTNSGGCGKWRPDYCQELVAAGVKRVAIFPDNDPPGEKHAQDVARSCLAAGLDAKIIHLPGLPPKGDVSNWLDAWEGHTKDDLVGLVEASPWVEASDLAEAGRPAASAGAASSAEPLPETSAGATTEHLTDLGNAKRLVARHGCDLRFCHPWGAWLVWDGRRWLRDETGELLRRAKETATAMYTQAGATGDEERRKLLAAHALRCEAESKLRAMVNVAASEAGIPVVPSALDSDLWMMTIINGTEDLRTGELRSHRREDLITKLAPVTFDPEATAPTWEKFLNSVFPGTPQVVRFLQKAVGYSLTGDTREQALLFLHGNGANGKTTFIRTIQELMGDYAKQAAPDLLMMKYGTEHPTGLADLAGARVVVCIEAQEGKRLAEALVKQMTGQDRMKGRRMREDYWEFSPTHKIWLVANHKPRIGGTDYAIWRRIRLIPFTVTFHPPESEEEPKQDPLLAEKLRAERSGILNWAIEGCLAWQREGLVPPAEVQAATAAYREESDVIGMFLAERCLIDPTERAKAGDLYRAYVEWCQANGERPVNQTVFGGKLAERGLEHARPSGIHTWRGIGLLPAREVHVGGDDDNDVPF
jgi:putative DNA primase/helicase